MSDVTSRGGSRAVFAGVLIDQAEESLGRAQKLLAGISGGWQKAVGSALSRAAATGKTAAKNAVAAEYTISQGQFLKHTRNINHMQKSSDGGVSVVFGFRGNVIPLLEFNTSVDGSGHVSTQVKRGGARAQLDQAFKAQMGAHTGVYERIGPERFPVREFYGPSTVQMMYSNEDVMDKVEEKMSEVYDKRIEHEILRLLNGWG